jgi:hypothetical protein
MPNYEVDYTYDIEESATNALYAADADAAEDETRKYVQDNFVTAKNIQIDAVREVKAAA